MHSDARLSAWTQRHLASIQGKEHDRFQSFGAGIAVTQNCIVSAYHVVKPVAVWGARGHVVRVKIGGESTDGVVIHWDPDTDLALVSLDRPIAKPAIFLFGMKDLLSTQSSDVIAFGFPKNSGDRNSPEPARFAPEHFQFAQLSYRIDAGSGLDQGFSGGPFVLGDHPDMPVIGLTQRGGSTGITILRHATKVVHYVMSHGVRPLLMPAWKMLENEGTDPEAEVRFWAEALDLPGTVLNWAHKDSLAGQDAQFRLLPTNNGLPVLMMEMVATRQQFGLDYGGRVMTGFASFKQLDHLSKSFSKYGLRIPRRNEWESAFYPANLGKQRYWPTGSENAPPGTVPPRGPKGPFGVQMAPPGHWEVVTSDQNRYELVAPPISPGGDLRCINLRQQPNPRTVVLRFCIDVPVPKVVAAPPDVRWEED